MKRKLTIVCFIIVMLYLLVALLGVLGLLPDFQTRFPIDGVAGYHPPDFSSIPMIFGLDQQGRSVFYLALAGTQTALTIGFMVSAIAIPIGVTLGSLAGFYGGKFDAFVVWLYTVVISVPYILTVIAISWVMGAGMFAICIAMGMISWVSLCRLTRGEFIKHRERDYVMAARVMGASDARLIFMHILPNVIHLAIISGSLMVLSSMKSEVILTYLGVGVDTGASWGLMINAAQGELASGKWWQLTGVVLAMFFIIYALNVIADALRDALDPKLND